MNVTILFTITNTVHCPFMHHAGVVCMCETQFASQRKAVPVCANLTATMDPEEPSNNILRKMARTSEFSAFTP